MPLKEQARHKKTNMGLLHSHERFYFRANT